MVTVILIIFYLAFSTFGLALIRLGASSTNVTLSSHILNLSVNLYTLGGLFLYVCSFVTWVTLLQRFKLSYIMPVVTGISYICVLLAGFFILHESINKFQMIGAAVILIGVVLMNIK